MAKITLNPPENLAEFTDMVEKYVNQEETLAALRESWKRTETKAATRPTKYYQFQIEEWTLLNSPINGDQKRSGV
jgi:hypothetical protein